MRIAIRYNGVHKKEKNMLVLACQKERATNTISARHIFFKSKRMPKHNIDCPSKETGNRKQPGDAIYITYLLTNKMTKWLPSNLFWNLELLVSFRMHQTHLVDSRFKVVAH